MAPIKFEEQLKEKLEKRSLQPSADSWAKLSERLDAEERKSKNPWFWWMGIAAGVIIMLAIAVHTFGSQDAQNTEPILVEEDATEESMESIQPNTNETQATELAVEDEQTETVNGNIQTEKPTEIINYKSVVKQQPKTKIQVAGHSKTDEIKSDVNNNGNTDKNTLIEEPTINTNAVTKAIEAFKSENTAVTDREVDSLLKLASKELFKDKLKKETSKTVDANSLLEDVEDEMGQSFRSKVFEALKDSYETVKTAVAERNN